MTEHFFSNEFLLASKLLNEVADGTLSGEEALKKWPFKPKSMTGDILAAWTAISHFSDDDDIRRRDEDYSVRRIRELQHLAERLFSRGTETRRA